jgi:hypothetical protein
LSLAGLLPRQKTLEKRQKLSLRLFPDVSLYLSIS